MSPAAVLCAAVAVAAGVSFAVVELRGTSSRAPVQDDASALQNDLAALQSEVAALRADLAAQTRMTAAPPISASPEASARTAVPTVSDAQVAAAVDRYLASLGDKLPAEAAALRAAAVDPKATFAELRTNASFWENGGNSDKYKKIFAAGKMDDLIAQFEQAAKADPRDAQAQMDLANAYLAYVQVDNSKYEYSLKADGVFDQVLAVDENHWEARFTKAMSYTFWPEFLGKKKEAISHFEHLVNQQDAMPVAEHEAQTYLILGNLLEQREPERAREIWERGLRRHPGNAELLAKLGK